MIQNFYTGFISKVNDVNDNEKENQVNEYWVITQKLMK